MHRVYLVDDEQWVLDTLENAIDWNEQGCTIVGSSTNSVHAKEAILNLGPDIVFSDISMPNITGLEMIESLTEAGLKTVFIILTGHAEFDFIKKAMTYDVVDYCLKPIEKDELLLALNKAKKTHSDKLIIKSMHQEDDSNSSNQTFTNVCRYINEHFKEELSLQGIAELFYVNPSYLSNLFKKEAGTNYSNYLSNIRLTYACNLLESTRLSINDVANQSGFTNYFYFARQFKKHIGMTPSDYRDQKRG